MRQLTQRWSRQLALRLKGAMVLTLVVWAMAATGPAQQPSDTAARSIDERLISVQLGEERRTLEVARLPGSDGFSLVDGATSKPLMGGNRVSTASVAAQDSQLLVNGTGVGTGCLIVVPSDGVIVIDQNRYRGKVEIVARPSGQILLRNVLALRWYLASVVGGEMPDWAPGEALKAQSIVSRSYILHKLERSEGSSAVLDTVSSQVYPGVSSESPQTLQAVEETAGLVLTYEQRVIDACFSACSGGHTASASDVWGNEVPYLKGRKDPFSQGGQYAHWRLEVSRFTIEKLLLRAGKDVGQLRAIKVVKRDSSGRASNIAFLGNRKQAEMRGADFRLLLGTTKLRSTMFDVRRYGSPFVFTGKGYGHGVGLSQWGACKMGQEGHSCKQILDFYYTGVELSVYSGPALEQMPEEKKLNVQVGGCLRLSSPRGERRLKLR